jgi:hypothetical protein
MTATRAFWRTDATYPSRTAAQRRARAIRWHPLIIERQLVVRIVETPAGWAVQVGANRAELLRIER